MLNIKHAQFIMRICFCFSFTPGVGQDGCDTYPVTYTDRTQKTIRVDVATPLESDHKEITVDIIDGVDDSKVDIQVIGNVALGSKSMICLYL